MIRQLKNLFHLFEAIAANIFYGFPSKKLKVIGVTGTDGKTTTTHLLYHLLKESGKKVSHISTINAVVAGEVIDTGLHTTTPSSFVIQKLLNRAVDQGDEYFVLEVTSHALDQFRVLGVEFIIGVVTNITSEHLDYHGTYENYLEAKSKLLLHAGLSVINRDDSASFPFLRQKLKEKHRLFVTYGFNDSPDYTFSDTQVPKDINRYNQYNYLAAYTVSQILKIPEEDVFRSLKSFQLPEGRTQVMQDKPFTIIIDFAHTPNSFDNLLRAVRGKTKTGALIHVFGAAGLRDKTKRSIMGETSGKWSNIVILTEEDYRTEDPMVICEEIASGLKHQKFTYRDEGDMLKDKNYTIIPDREKAIQKALSLAQTGDIVIITGKGHEKSLCRGTREYPWDESKVVEKYLKEGVKRAAPGV